MPFSLQIRRQQLIHAYMYLQECQKLPEYPSNLVTFYVKQDFDLCIALLDCMEHVPNMSDLQGPYLQLAATIFNQVQRAENMRRIIQNYNK